VWRQCLCTAQFEGWRIRWGLKPPAPSICRACPQLWLGRRPAPRLDAQSRAGCFGCGRVMSGVALQYSGVRSSAFMLATQDTEVYNSVALCRHARRPVTRQRRRFDRRRGRTLFARAPRYGPALGPRGHSTGGSRRPDLSNQACRPGTLVGCEPRAEPQRRPGVTRANLSNPDRRVAA
jgi:hypothetical protein